MFSRSQVLAVMLTGALAASAQVASHAPTAVKAPVPSRAPEMKAAGGLSPLSVSAMAAKPVAKVNGAVLSEIDLLREMYAIFPYAQQHNGFPKDLEPEIRRGALEMIIFEELLYQEGKKRNLSVAPERVAKGQTAFRKQFPTNAAYEQYLQAEMNGDKAVLKEKIRRSLLIERMLKTEVNPKAQVTPADVKAYYDKNSKQFEHGETFRLQTISIMPPQNGGADVAKEARKRAEDALKQAKATKSYREFGLLAEKVSDDDFHVNMGDHKEMEASKLPPEIVKAASKMKPGDVSELLQFGSVYTVFRVVSHTTAGKTPFAEVKVKLTSDLRKQKLQEVRSALGAKLRKSSKVEIL